MIVELPFEAEPGQLFDIDGLRHVLDRIDTDGEYVIRRLGAQTTFKVPNPQTGFPEHPRAAAFLALMAEGRIELVENDPANADAAIRRKMKLSAAQARALDPNCDLRARFLHAYDTDPCNLSDRELVKFYRALLADAEFYALACAAPKARRRGSKIFPWIPCGRTLRTWTNNRGKPGDRRHSDCINRSGKGPRKKTIRHPASILAHWLSRATVNKRDVLKNHQSYLAELNRISDGEPSGRFDSDGEPITFPRPSSRYRGVSYSTFMRHKRRLKGRAATEARDGKDAADADFGGGGIMERATRVGELCRMDDTPVPILCKIVAHGLVWVGQPTYGMLHDCASHAILGSDLSWDEASAATVLRTIAAASMPKIVPADMEHAPQLAMVMAKPDRLACDNLSAHHSRDVEDACRELTIDVDFTGAGKPRDKADTESYIGTVLDLAFKGMTAAVGPIALRRHNKNDPSAELLPTIQEARELLRRAEATINISSTKALFGRSPLAVFVQQLNERKISVIKDVSRLRSAASCVEYDVELRASGIEIFKVLRYIQKPGTPSLFDKLCHRQRPSKRTKVASVKVKVKYDPDNILRIDVFDPISRTNVIFENDFPEYADLMPKWAHDLVLSDIAADEQQFCSKDMLIEYRARLFERQSDVTQTAGEDERRRAARLADTAAFRQVMGEIVEVLDEHEYFVPPAIDTDHRFVDTELASETSLDFDMPTPRSAPRKRGNTSGSQSISRAREKSPKNMRDTNHTAVGNRPTRPKSSANRKIEWSKQYG